MADFIGKYASEILTFVVGLLGGGTVGSLITLRFVQRNRAGRHGSVVDQSSSRAGGDIVGRDKTT
jgi:hypothetical protein